MHLVLFDIDGTLVQSYDFDSECFQAAVRDVLGITIGPDWSRYLHVTDSGILAEVIEDCDPWSATKVMQLTLRLS